MKDVTLNQLEQTRLHMLNSVLEHQLPVAQAAEILGVSERHAWRILATYRKEGAAALAHGNRGRRPRNAVSDDEAAAVIQLASTTYAGANHTHLTELLRDREGIDLSRPDREAHPDQGRHPQPAQTASTQAPGTATTNAQEGCWCRSTAATTGGWAMTVPNHLLLAVDDATGAVATAVFRPEEDTRGYFILMQGLIERRGVPTALYSDRHGVFKFSGKPRHIQPPVEATHFSRALVELGIPRIFARSPQAKGRVERAASTFQDRLVTELRLAGASTIDQANAVLRDFLPVIAQRTGVPESPPLITPPESSMTTAAGDPQIVPRPPAGKLALRAADQGVASALESVLSDNTKRVYAPSGSFSTNGAARWAYVPCRPIP